MRKGMNLRCTVMLTMADRTTTLECQPNHGDYTHTPVVGEMGMLRQTILATSFETICRSRTVGPRFQALAGATPRGSLAAFLWPTDR